MLRRWGFALICLLSLLALAGCEMGWPVSGTPVVSGGPIPAGTETPGLPPACLARDLEGVAGWQGATGALVGAVSVVNKGRSPCTLDGRPGVHLVKPDGGMLPVTNVEASDDPNSCCAPLHGSPVVVAPGGKAFARFAWRNYCGTVNGPFRLAVALPGEGGQITAPVLDASGKPLADTPRCDSTDFASTLTVGAFVSAP